MRKTVSMIMLVLCAACGQTEKHSTEKPQVKWGGLASLGPDASIYPLADGGAFLVDTGPEPPTIYYLRGDRAVRVKAKPLRRRWAVPLQLADAQPDAYPLVDGTAYLLLVREEDRAEVFHLTGTKAVRVSETSTLAGPEGLGPLIEEFAWVTLQNHITRMHRDEKAEEWQQEGD